jgi:alpha-ketoglutarate-dependent taurine dioxygenase/acyl carrier protein
MNLQTQVLMSNDGDTRLCIIEPTKGDNNRGWLDDYKSDVKQQLCDYGAILLRGFGLGDVTDLQDVAKSLCNGLAPYKDRGSPRSVVNGRVYTATDSPRWRRIELHNEGAFTSRFPGRIFFQCLRTAETGGSTPIVDSRSVYRKIDPVIREKFEQLGVAYVRNFGLGPGMDWRDVFQVNNREELQQYCDKAAIQLQWLSQDHLRTIQVRPAVSIHHGTGQPSWFNHICAQHVATLDSTLRDTLRRQFTTADLPVHVHYGDGSPISDEVVLNIQSVVDSLTLRFEWQVGDILLLDNIAMGHGRDPFEGDRQIVVGLADLLGFEDLKHSSTAQFVHLAENTVDQQTQLTTTEAPSSIHSIESIESIMVLALAQALKIPEASLHDDFFALGGDSIAATQIITEVKDKLSLELPLELIFEEPTASDWAQWSHEKLKANRGD